MKNYSASAFDIIFLGPTFITRKSKEIDFVQDRITHCKEDRKVDVLDFEELSRVSGRLK